MIWLELCTIYSSSFHDHLHFQGETGLAGVYWSKRWWRWWQLDYWSYKSCKAAVKSSPQTNQHSVVYTGWMPFLSPNKLCQSTEGKNITFYAFPSSPGSLPTLSLTINSSWVSWGRVAIPLISPLMPVPLLLVVWWLFTVYYFVQYRYSVWICNVSVSTYVHYASVTLSFPFS